MGITLNGTLARAYDDRIEGDGKWEELNNQLALSLYRNTGGFGEDYQVSLTTDTKGIVVAASYKSIWGSHFLLYEDSLTDLPGMELVTSRFLAGESGYKEYVYIGVHKTTGFAIVNETRWSVLLTLPQVEFLAPTIQIRNIIILTVLISFIAAFTVFYYFAWSLI